MSLEANDAKTAARLIMCIYDRCSVYNQYRGHDALDMCTCGDLEVEIERISGLTEGQLEEEHISCEAGIVTIDFKAREREDANSNDLETIES